MQSMVQLATLSFFKMAESLGTAEAEAKPPYSPSAAQGGRAAALQKA